MSGREIKGRVTTGVRGEGELSIYKSFTSIIAILWLDCATQYLQLKRGCMHTHEQTNKAMYFYTADVKKKSLFNGCWC